MLESMLCDYSDASILLKAKYNICKPAQAVAQATKKRPNFNKIIVFKHSAPYTDSISETNNTQVDKAKEIGKIIPIFNLIENSNVYLKTCKTLWQYYRDELPVNKAADVIGFLLDNNHSILVKFKEKITGQTVGDDTRDVEMIISLKYLTNFGQPCH